MCKWKLSLLPLVLALVSCAAEKPVINTEYQKPDITWPVQLEVCEYSFKFEAVENKPVVIIDYSNWVTLTKCREAEINYIKNLSNMICYYKTTNDVRCKND